MTVQVEKKALVWLFVAFMVSKAWTLLPESTVTYSFIPFYDVQLTARTYAWILCSIAMVSIMWWGILPLFAHIREEVFIICCLFLLDIPDFLILYCEPLVTLHVSTLSLPVEYGLIKGLTFGVITLITWYK